MALQSPCSGSRAHTWIEDVILKRKDLKRESDDHVDDVDVHPFRVFLFLLLDTLEFAIIKKKHTYMTMVIFLMQILQIVLNMTLVIVLMMILMIVLMMTMMIALMTTIMMILLMLTRPCVNRVVPPPTHLSRHSYNLKIIILFQIITIAKMQRPNNIHNHLCLGRK